MSIAKITSKDGSKIRVEIELELSGSMLDMEDSILNACNSIGCIATEEALQRFDTDGSAIIIGDTKYTVNKVSQRDYETPYGRVQVKRNLYQTSKGGKTFIPLEEKARIIHGATPRFAKLLASKYAKMQGSGVLDDLEDSHNRHVSLQYVQDTSEIVSAIAEIKEEVWEYEVPKLSENITSVSISLDGAQVGMKNEGYRETMAGTISLYDIKGERQHTIYIGASPEYGKAKFYQKLSEEIRKIKLLYPDVPYIGLADGAKSNWSFLEKHTKLQVLDFYHATEYMAEASESIINPIKRKEWMDSMCHTLKHTQEGAQIVLNNMQDILNKSPKLSKAMKIKLEGAITYFKNNLLRMKYAANLILNLPIGSGVIEAACKTLIKQRCCNSGMRWKEKGLRIVLTLRALVQTKGRWSQFWNKINQFGAPIIA